MSLDSASSLQRLNNLLISDFDTISVRTSEEINWFQRSQWSNEEYFIDYKAMKGQVEFNGI